MKIMMGMSMRMKVKMWKKVFLMVEYSFAIGAGKGKLSYIGFYVFFQVVHGDELFATHVAVVRLLPSVNSPVHGKVERVRVNLVTLDTSIWLAIHKLILMDPQ